MAFRLVARLRARSRRGNDRGTVLIETAMVAMFFMTVVVGTFELGMGWRTSITVNNAARAGARVGSSLGINAEADYSLLVSVASALESSGQVNLTKVIVFKSSSATGTVPSTCKSLNPGSSYTGNLANHCNVYSGTWIAGLVSSGSSAAFTSTATSTCSSGGGSRPDRWWCPSIRNNVQLSSGGLDYLGVYVEVSHSTITKVFGTKFTIDQTSVMRIEPEAGK